MKRGESWCITTPLCRELGLGHGERKVDAEEIKEQIFLERLYT